MTSPLSRKGKEERKGKKQRGREEKVGKAHVHLINSLALAPGSPQDPHTRGGWMVLSGPPPATTHSPPGPEI
eukprot:4072145-Karenia_brevis.AAC.1